MLQKLEYCNPSLTVPARQLLLIKLCLVVTVCTSLDLNPFSIRGGAVRCRRGDRPFTSARSKLLEVEIL